MPEYTNTAHGVHISGVRLGIQEMPPGYRLDQLDSGHYMWVELVDGGPDYDLESVINWDRWAAWRGAWEHYKEQMCGPK